MSYRQSRSLIGIGLMLSAMALLPFLDVVAKHLGRQGVPVMQIVWARLFFGALMTLPFALRIGGIRGLVPNLPAMHALRASLIIAATAFFFAALHYLSIAETLAIFFVQPLIVTILSPVVLGEHVGIRRWAAVTVGFIGTLIIIRPGFQDFSPGMFLALCSGTSLAIYLLLTRKIAGSAPAILTTFYTSLTGALVMSVIVLFYWIPPTPSQWGFFVLLSLIANFGHYLIVKAYDHAEASLLAPLAYTEMIMATFAGWYFFGDFPDGWTFVGVGVLISSAVYISMRERVRRIDPVRDFEQP
jgi:drug/metabolite transporter (DMT)-like permease